MASDDRIAATETAFEILDAVHESQGATAAELIEATDLSRGGVYKHLRTLVAVDALVNHDGVYALGPKFTEYSLGAAEVYPVLDQTDKVDELAQSLDAPTNLWANDADNCLCVYTALPSDREDYPRRRGDSEPLVKSPPGKVILARTADERRSELTRRHDDELQAQLEALREQQLLEEPLRFAPEWVSIATPVLDPSDQPVAALEVVVPAERANSIDIKNNVRGLLTETAHRIRVDML